MAEERVRSKNILLGASRLFSRGGAVVCAAFLAALAASSATHAQIPAFPGAEGFGAFATGGRSGDVYHVINLNSSGAGSFANGVATVPANGRTIVFDVSGYINISGTMNLHASKVTIAGQTAPGDGIGVKNGTFNISSSENIIRHFRFRDGYSADALDIDSDSTNTVIDHCDTMLGNDENFSSFSSPPENVTFQWSMNSWGMETHSCGGLWDQKHATAHHTLWSHNHTRNPKARPDGLLEWINNVTFDWDIGFIMGDSETPANWKANVQGCYFVCPPTNLRSVALETALLDRNGNPNFTIYLDNCFMDANGNGVLDVSKTGYDLASGQYATNGTPFPGATLPVTMDDPLTAFKKIVSAAGPLRMETDPAKPLRDEMSNILISNLVNQIAHHVSAPSETGAANGGFGFLNSASAPLDTDQDGMPDFWENTLGSNGFVDDHTNQVPAGAFLPNSPAGYTLLEEYLQFLALPHATIASSTSTNLTALDVDLRKFTRGFTAPPVVFAVTNAVNGVATMRPDGYTARFSPTTNFTGRARFDFSVTDGDGSTWTQTVVAVVISASAEPALNLVWRGDGVANIWDTNTFNWVDVAVPARFKLGDFVTFDDSGSNSPAVSLVGSLSPGGITVNATQDYTFAGSGSLYGPGGLSKSGSGKLTINTINTSLGGAAINDGTVQFGDGVSVSGSFNGNVTNNANLIFANPTNVTMSMNISGTGTVTKIGAGTLTLSGAQTYSGLTTVNAGTLEFSGAAPSGDIIDNSSVTFKPSSPVTYAGLISGSGTVTMNAGGQTLTLSGVNTYTGGTDARGGNLFLANNSAAGSGVIAYYSGMVQVGNGVVITNNFSVPTATTDLCMMSPSGTGTWAGNIVNLGSSAQWRPGSDGGTLIFIGTAAQGTRNFIVPRGNVIFASNAYVAATGTATALGRDSGANHRSSTIRIRDNASLSFGLCSMGGGQAGSYVIVTLQDNAALSTGATNFDIHNVNWTPVTNTFNLNGGTLTVGGIVKTRSYPAFLNLNGGILRAGVNNSAFLPALSGLTITNKIGGVKVDDAGFAITITQPILHDVIALGGSLDGGLVKVGSGTLTLAGANTFNGGTIVSNGTLLANNTLGSATGTGAVTVVSGATLGGTGSVRGPVTIANGGALAPGASAGTLWISNNLVLNSASVLRYELGTASDRTVVSGNLTLGGTLNITDSGGLTGTTYTLLTYPVASNFVYNGVSIGTAPAGYTYAVDTATVGQVRLTVGYLPVVAGFSASPTNGVAPLAVTFTDTSSGVITSRSWNFGDGNTTNFTVATNPVHAYGAGTYTVRLVASGPAGVSTNTQPNLITVVTPFAAWQQQYFGCTNCPQAAVDADPDGDALDNVTEFMAGSNPTNSSSGLWILSTIPQSNDVLITWATAGGRTNALQAAAGDAEGDYDTNFVDVSGPVAIPGSGDAITNYLDVGGMTNVPTRYYRIRLVP